MDTPHPAPLDPSLAMTQCPPKYASASANVVFFTDIQRRGVEKKSSLAWFTLGVYISVSALRLQKMVSRGRTLPTPALKSLT